ncbi:MAG: hypothetical protein AB8G11_15185 [Saprospiraceae bacterium]
MITLEYLNKKLSGYDYVLQENTEIPVFIKKINHRNFREKMAFSVIFITLDKYTVTIEGMNEMLIRRAVDAGAIEIPDLETFNLLRDIIYDTTTDTSIKAFETIFHFFEQQITELKKPNFGSDEYETALKNMRLLVDAANNTPIEG